MARQDALAARLDAATARSGQVWAF
jgi:hypothetical protein